MALQAAWNFDEASGDALDVVAGLPLAITGERVAGVTGSAVAPVSSTAPAGSAELTLSGVTALTVAGKVRVYQTGGYASMLSLYEGATRRFRVGRGSAASLHAEVTASSGVKGWVYTGDNTLSLADWRHVAAVWNRLGNGALELFIDGVPQAISNSGGAASTGALASTVLYLGDPASGAGVWDDLRVYDEALSAAQIAALVDQPVVPVVPDNIAPVAEAGSNRAAFTGQQVTLSGSGSVDTDGTVVGYTWSQVSGPTVALAGSGATRTFTPTQVGSYVFSLVVSDNDGAVSAADTVTIIASAPPAPVVTNDPLSPILLNILEFARASLEEAGRPVGHVSFQPGNTVSWDDCGDCAQGGQLWVRLISLVPQPAGPQPCGVLANQVRAAIGIVRCVHGLTDEGFPTPAQMTGDALDMTQDALLLQTVLSHFDWPSKFVGPKTPKIETGLPLGPQGFCAGFEWTFNFAML